MGTVNDEHAAIPWGVVSVKAQVRVACTGPPASLQPAGAALTAGRAAVCPQDVDYELPMQPITMMRNSLGKDQGGSGEELDQAKYKESVAYWSNHVTVV
jgi:hypothetical protein